MLAGRHGRGKQRTVHARRGPPTSQHDLREFLVGIEGLAILRHWGTDATVVAARARRHQLATGPPVATDSAMLAFHEVPVGQGCAAIAADYDTTPNVIAQTEEAAVRGLLERLPLAAGAVDVTVCALALTHLADPTAAIVELGRVTRPGGRVVRSDVHPVMATLGYHAFHRSADGTRALVRNHPHLHATYVAAFRVAGLTVRGCLEPRWTEATVAAQRWVTPVPEAARQALVGLPMVLIWELDRADGYARR